MKKTFFVLIALLLSITTGCTFEQVNTFTNTAAKLPAKKTVEVPFTPQAPEGNWAEPWQNACEETAIIMIDNFYKGDEVTKEKAKQEILKIFQVKENVAGPSADEAMAEIARIISKADLGWSARVIDSPTLEDMKAELAANRPIIVPIDAKKVDNPNLAEVDYHVIVVKGYDDQTQEFITNDPGTSRGEGFRYTYDDLYTAIHDFSPEKTYVAAGPKRVLFTSPK